MSDFVDSYAPIDSDPVTDKWPRPSPFYWNPRPPQSLWQRVKEVLIGVDHE